MSDKLPIKVTSESQTSTELNVSVRDHSMTVDEPESFGGNNNGANPLEYMFTALAGCLNVTIHHIASENDVKVNTLEIEVDGELDLGKFKTGKGDRAGFQDIEADIAFETDASEQLEQKIIEEAESRCPVSDNLQNETDLNIQK